MGSYVSVPECKSYYNITINCQLEYTDNTNTSALSYGDVVRGQFKPDPDIAGIGIVGVFLAVTCLALSLGVSTVFWQGYKLLSRKRRNKRQNSDLMDYNTEKQRVSVQEILETMVLSCSDQQVFTGAAFAMTLRYWKGCQVSAYHYNVIANMLLLTCATHLMAVTVVRNYWRYLFLGILRLIVMSGVFLFTGLLLANQNATPSPRFPTDVPKASQSDSLLFLPAACFQGSASQLVGTLGQSFHDSNSFTRSLIDSTPDNRIRGWNYFLMMLLWYAVAAVAEVFRFIHKGRNRPDGRRARMERSLREALPILFRFPILGRFIMLAYLFGGIVIASATVFTTAQYIMALRSWIKYSGWAYTEDDVNSEDDATSFGQLVPLFLTALTLFTFLQMLSEKLSLSRRRHQPAKQNGVVYAEPHSYVQAANYAQAPIYTQAPIYAQAPVEHPPEKKSDITQSTVEVPWSPRTMSTISTPATPGKPFLSVHSSSYDSSTR